MGDYNKLIVTCTVKSEIEEELNLQIEELGLCSSAYQSDEFIIDLTKNKYHKEELNVIIVGQTKWGYGQNEFCEWLKPYVIQGSGKNDVYAMSFSEYSDTPQMWKLNEEND